MTVPKFKWEYGPAFLGAVINALVFIIGFLAIWFNLPSDLKAANAQIVEMKSTIATLIDATNKHENRMIKTETALDFIVPTLKRIEEKVDRLK